MTAILLRIAYAALGSIFALPLVVMAGRQIAPDDRGTGLMAATMMFILSAGSFSLAMRSRK